jgi:ADP-ribose pyrophosphatase YjhB (NUDIX family)
MLQMYKVFVNDKVIFFTKNTKLLSDMENVLVLHYYDNSIISMLVDYLRNDDKLKHLVFLTFTPEEDFISFKNNFELIIAAGGKVSNAAGNILFIFRLGKWDLPKGKVEVGETLEESAIREVEEECGISKLTIINHLKDTYHLYELNNKMVIKQSVWYEMKTDDASKLIPQIEENITDARWMTNEEIQKEVMKNTYPSIKEII